MHAHSLLWFGALLFALAHVYRRIEPSAPALCGFALLLYAIDDAHGATVGWIANRNAIISACLALPALAYHHRWVAEGFRRGAWLAPLWLLLGLCAGETALCIIGSLVAYACCLDARPWRERALSSDSVRSVRPATTIPRANRSRLRACSVTTCPCCFRRSCSCPWLTWVSLGMCVGAARSGAGA
jgi:hypothetical protein